MMNIPNYFYLPYLKQKLLYGLNHHIITTTKYLSEKIYRIRKNYMPNTGQVIYINDRENIDKIISKEKLIVVSIQSRYINSGNIKYYRIKPNIRYITIRDILITLDKEFIIGINSLIIYDFISKNGFFFKVISEY